MPGAKDRRPSRGLVELRGSPRRGRRLGAVLGIAAAVVAAAAITFLLVRQPVTVDGRTVWVARGATVASLRADGLIVSPPGDLLTVKGALLRKGAGGQAVVAVGGSAATSTTPLAFGAVVTSRRGPDVTEPTTSKIVGADKVTVGAISGVELSRVTVGEYGVTVTTAPVDTGGRKLVALTFDDGPWQGQTQKILDILLRYHAKATFFMIGRQAEHLPYLSRLVVADGMEVGDHTQSHKALLHASKATVTYEIGVGATTIRRYSGAVPTWYRPAGGTTDPFILSEARRLDLRVALWTLDTEDWTKPGTAAIVKKALGGVQPGSIVLMHDGGGDRSQTIAALPQIIQGLIARGYKMVTLSELNGLPPQKIVAQRH